jgi:hypothetical protein
MSDHDENQAGLSRPASAQAPLQAPVVVPAQRARQGVTGHNVRYVLGFGLVCVIIAFVVAYVLYFVPHTGS